MPLKILSIILFLQVAVTASGQGENRSSFNKQLSFADDNDLFAFKGTDRYYTNGITLNYTYAATPKKSSVIKTLHQWELGQKMYTAYKRQIYTPAEIDRPIAGYLYGRYSTCYFREKNQLLKIAVSVGTIGEASLAEALQDVYHPLVRINASYWGWIWNYQLKNEVGANFDFTYAKAFIKNSSRFQVTSISNATLGSIFTNAAQGFLLQVGKLEKMSNSSYWGAHGSTLHNEFFIFYKPQLMYQLYNATIEGGFFRKDKGPITDKISPFVFSNTIGFAASVKRYSIGFNIVYQTKEACSQLNNHAYGRVTAACGF